MAFNFNLAISIPGTPAGPVATTLKNAVMSHLGEDSDGLTPRQAGELACRRFLRGLYDKEIQRVDAANDTAAARTEIDTCRATIDTQIATIRSLEQALRDQAETDWA